MFSNFSLPELLIVGAIALIVIGPKELPQMMRSLGKFVGQARGLARQFQDSMNDAAREMELDELRKARQMMNRKADTSAVTDPFNKMLDIDDDGSDATPEPPKARALDSEERDKRAGESGFDASDKGEPESAKPVASPMPEAQEDRKDEAKAI